MTQHHCLIHLFFVFRLKASGGKANGHTSKKTRTRVRDRSSKAFPAPDANAELQANIDVCTFFLHHPNFSQNSGFMFLQSSFSSLLLQQRRRLITHANAKCKSEKFPPPHQDGSLGFTLGSPHHYDSEFHPSETSFSTVFPQPKGSMPTWSGPLVEPQPTTTVSHGGHSRWKKQASSGRISSR